MKIAFVNDSCERLGVGYIAALLRSFGHDVQLFIDPQYFNDENISIRWLHARFDYKKTIVPALKAFAPDLIGFSVVSDFYPWACQMANLIKMEITAPIIFGGIHPTSVPERVIRQQCVDMVCVGEGEYPTLELVQSMETGIPDYSIKNIWFKKDGKIIKNEQRNLISDLNTLPFPAKDLFYTPSPHLARCYYIMASRGCAYSCSYCCHSILKQRCQGKGAYFRQRSVDNVLAELKTAKAQYGIRYVRFFDDSLGLNIAWLKEFSKKYRREIGLPFICYMYPSHVSPDTSRLLKEAGCCEVEIGVQSLNEDLSRTVLHRDMPVRTIASAIDILKNEKIRIIADNIVGLPGQQEADLIRMAEFYNQRRVNRIYFFWLRYYPGTAITEYARETGVLSPDEYELIMDGAPSRPFSRGGNTMNAEWTGLQFLLILIPLLPARAVTWIIQKKLYRYFGKFRSPGIFAALTSLFSTAYNDKILIRREIARYSRIFKGASKQWDASTQGLNMRIAFISNAYESMGFEYLAAVLKAAGHEVKLFMDPELFNDSDTTISLLGRIFNFKPQLIADLKPFNPDLIAFSVITDSYSWACDLARRIKDEMDVPIIFGGIHATSSPESVIANDCIDMVCLGEGEHAMLELADSLARGQINQSIQNIWFKADGKIIKNELRPLIGNLDTLPFADKDLYYSVSPHFRFCYYIITNRGCPHACSYCIHSYLKKLYRGKGPYCRQRSVDNVINELVRAKEAYHIKLVRFMDDCFPNGNQLVERV